MKIVCIMGSPRINGNGSNAINSFIKGAKITGATCIRYDLCKLNIKNCIGCRRCIKNNGVCVMKDDMTGIFEDIKTADVLLINSPIFINQVNGYVKTFLDRLYPMTDKYHKPRYGKRKLVMLYTYGVPLPFVFDRYIRATGKSLKAMGLVINKNIVLKGCTTIDKIKNDEKIKNKLQRIGKSYGMGEK